MRLNYPKVFLSGVFFVTFFSSCGILPNSNWITAKKHTPNGVVTFRQPKNISADEIEKIIHNPSQLTPVLNNGANIPAKLRPLINTFGLISMGCTATHIGNGIAITAGHCFEAPETRTNNVNCDGITVRWGFRQDQTEYLTSKCVKILAYELNNTRDYAIFKVDKIPPVKLSVNINAKPAIGTKITIFGFPQARPMEWSQYCTVQSSENGHYGVNQFSHQCDTEPGNSGSTIIDATTLKVVGIHDGGIVPWNYGTYLVDTPLNEFL